MNRARAALVVVLGLAGAGCYSSVAGPVGATRVHSDELWYVKERYFLFVRTSREVYYCPPGASPHAKVCTKAVLHDDGE